MERVEAGRVEDLAQRLRPDKIGTRVDEDDVGTRGVDELGGLGGASAGGLLTGGLGELIERFRQNGQADAADSWVSTGPNKELPPNEFERAIGPDVLATLSQQTGLSRDELLARLSREVPRAVDGLTPQGRLPTEDEFDRA